MKSRSLIVLSLLGGALGALCIQALPAFGHTYGSAPAFTTWTDGDTLTAASLNNSFGHLHNTFSGNIANAHISSSAAISHSKLATPALVAKAWGIVGASSPCDGAAAANTVCASGTNEYSQVTDVESSGTAGTYRVKLAYTPVNVGFMASVTSNTTLIWCNALSLATSYPYITVECRTVSTGTVTNATFSFVVFDS